MAMRNIVKDCTRTSSHNNDLFTPIQRSWTEQETTLVPVQERIPFDEPFMIHSYYIYTFKA